MARRASLAEAGVTRPSHTAPLLPAPVQPMLSEAKRPPARQGKKAVAFWVDPAASQQLRIASIHQSRSVQDIMEEALADWFRKHRLPQLGGEAA